MNELLNNNPYDPNLIRRRALIFTAALTVAGIVARIADGPNKPSENLPSIPRYTTLEQEYERIKEIFKAGPP